MAVIPSPQALGQSDAQPDIAPVTYPRQFGRPNQVGEAMADTFGREAQKSQQDQDQADAFDYATARSTYLTGKVQLEQQIQDDPNNWQSAGERYQAGMAKLQSDTAEGVTNPKFQKQFAMESGSDAAQGLAQINHWQRGREVDQGRATIDNTTQANLTAALASPADAPNIIAAHQTLLDGAVAKGYISDQESVTQQRSFTTNYAKGAVDSMPDAEQVQVLSKRLPALAAGMAPGGGAQAQDVKSAILGQESGNNPNAPTSVTGAVGPGQVEPGTFKRFAKPGESIDNPADNAAVSGRYVDYLSGLQNVQGDPARVAVGYFSGEKNIAPPGFPTPWLADKKDPTGKSTSSYVSDVLGRVGKPSENPADQGHTVAVTGTPADFLDAPTAATMLREAQARLRADGAAANQAYAGSVRDTISYLQSGGDPSKVTLSPTEVSANVRGEEGQGLADELGHAIDYNKAVTQVATATPQQVQQILQSHGVTPEGSLNLGPADFRANAASAESLLKAAQERQTALFGDGKTPGDPAAYAIGAMKDVGNAYTIATQKGDPVSFDAYVQRLNGSYQTLGVPPENRSILPRNNAQNVISTLQSKSPQEALGKLDALKAESGKWWPAVYRDLAKAGLPPSFQVFSVVDNPQDRLTMVSALQKDADARASGGKPMADAMVGLKTADGKSVVESVEKQLSQPGNGMDSLRQSFGFWGRQGVDTYSGISTAARAAALYLYSKGGLTPEQAADQGAAIITKPFDFVNQSAPDGPKTARIPKGSRADFDAATAHVLGQLKEGDVTSAAQEVDAEGNKIDMAAPERAKHVLANAQSAYWETIPGDDGKGAVRAFDPATRLPVILKGTGKPLDIPFARFHPLATLAQKTAIAQPSDAPSPEADFAGEGQ